MNSQQAAELVEESERRGLVLMVGHLLLYHPAVRRLKQGVDDGELGDIHYVYAQRLNLGTVRSDENALWSLAPHDISVAAYLFGADPIDASARGSCYLQRGSGIEDVVFANIGFPEGRVLNLHVSWLDPHKIRCITVVGSQKMAVFDDMENTEKLRIYDKGVDVPPVVSYGDSLTLRYGDIHIPHLPMGEPLRAECEHFVQCVETGERPLTDGPSGLAVVQALEACQRSLEQGGAPVTIAAG
jgi:predicted dehydrogenase